MEWTPLMAEIQVTGIAAVIAAIAALVTSAGVAYVQVRSVKVIKETAADVKTAAKDVEEVKTTTKQIDRAVNGKRPEDQTISEQVEDLHAEIPPKEPVVPADQVAVLPLVRAMAVTQTATQEQLNTLESKIDAFLTAREPNGNRSTDAT